ncbi:MAG TPA: APC family permease, partial [Thermoplasmataceae archaeon]|nr:APC family permease [Thermoplasmataceae archaeon]
MNLKSDILSPRLAIFQSIAQLAPLPTLIFTIQEIFGYSDAPALSYLIALVIVLFSVNTVMQMGSRFPNAGGYYSYVAKGISKSAGVYTQFLYLFYQVLNTAAVVIFSSWVLQIFLGIFGYQIRGFYLLAIPLVMIFVVPYFGIRISAMFYLITALIEIGIVLVLSVLLVAFPNSSSSFSAPMIPHVGISAFALSIIYSLFFFTGYGSVLTLAEETKTPRKSIPLMALFSVVGIGLLEFFYIYASDVNWGTSLTATFASASTFPTFISAQRFLGVFGLVITGSFAYISFLKGNIAIQNATSRGIFALARDGVIPKRLSAVHRRYGSPHLAIIFNEVVSLIIIAVVYLVFYFILGI